MSRWRKAVIVSTVGLASAVGLTALSHTPASAAPADLVVNYTCTASGPDSIVRHGPVKLTTRLNFATDLFVGDPLNFTWKLAYADSGRLQSPNYFGANAQVHMVGNVQLVSSWQGILQPKGLAAQTTKLRPDSNLTLPSALTDPGLMDKVGTIKITPKDIEVDFTPPDGTVAANDGNETDNPIDLQVQYSAGWTSLDDRPASEHHVHNDLHETSTLNASASMTFVGTGIEYIGPHDKDAGPVDVYIDGTKRATVDPSRDDDGQVVNDDLDGGFTLWKSPELQYGEHTIKVQNASTKPMWVDAFNVVTNTNKVPTGYHSARCQMDGGPVSIEVTVKPKPGSTPTSTVTPTTTSTATSTSTATTTPPHSQVTPGSDPRHVSVVIKGTPSTAVPVTTATSAGPTATRYVKAQVAKTPKGGVDTGEAPEAGREPYALMAGGSLLLLGSAAGGGLLLRRRRAEHAGGADA